MNLFGPPDPLKLKNKKNVKGLEKALFYKKDRFVRLHAADYLGDFGDKTAADSLVRLIKVEQDKTIKVRATVALAKLKDTRAIYDLVCNTAFHSKPGREYYNFTVDLIADYGDSAIGPLSPFFSSFIGGFERHILALKCAVKIKSYKVTPYIIRLIDTSHNTPKIREAGILALGEMKDPSALPRIKEALYDPTQIVREAAKEALKAYDLI